MKRKLKAFHKVKIIGGHIWYPDKKIWSNNIDINSRGRSYQVFAYKKNARNRATHLAKNGFIVQLTCFHPHKRTYYYTTYIFSPK